MLKPDIFFENDSIVAVNKPSGLLTLPDRFDAELDSLKGILNKKYGQIFVVHRLDRDTSGLIIFAKTPQAHQYYSRLFEERKVEKIYVGLVQGTLPDDEGRFDQPIGNILLRRARWLWFVKGNMRSPIIRFWNPLANTAGCLFGLKQAVHTRSGCIFKMPGIPCFAILYIAAMHHSCYLLSKRISNYPNQRKQKDP